jgi:hypothetical protein
MVYACPSHNRTVYARRLTAARATKKPSRASPFVGFFFATFLRLLELLRNSFIATAKTSYTAETLCERKTRNIYNIFMPCIHAGLEKKKAREKENISVGNYLD